MEKLQRKPLLYVLFTFLITWVGWGFLAYQAHINYPAGSFINSTIHRIAGYSPMLVSLFLMRKFFFRKNFLISFFLGTIKNKIRYGIVILLFIMSLSVYLIFKKSSQSIPIDIFLSTYCIQCIFGGGLEEIGWRGYLQPALESRLAILPAIIIIGILWSLWHLPLWINPGTYQEGTNFLLYTIHTLITALSLSAIFKLTNSVLICILYHGWTNTLFISIPFTMNLPYWIVHISEGFIAAFICFYIVQKEEKQKNAIPLKTYIQSTMLLQKRR